MNRKQALAVEIKKLVNGGYGLGRWPGGKTVLVRGALPGEIVAINPVERRSRVDFADAVSVIRPHYGRVVPPCPYYGDCGGCDLQHADYPTQCAVKSQILADLLLRSNSKRLQELSAPLEPVVASPDAFGYRQRIRLHVEGQGRLGFHRFRSSALVPISRCLLAAGPLNRCLSSMERVAPFQQLIGNSEAVEFHLNPLDDRVSLLFRLTRPPRPADRRNAALICHPEDGIARVYLAGDRFATEGPFSADGAADPRFGLALSGSRPLNLCWEAEGFAQVNTKQNSALIDLVVALSGVRAGDRVLDCFCGMGNFSLPLATRAAGVVGLESQGSAVRSARFAAKSNRLANVSFIKDDVRTGCAALAAKRAQFDVVVCDPPRQGMAGLAPLLSRLTRRSLLYISCDPATLVRDLEELELSDFTSKTIRPIDMFPQTHHIETVALLEKN